MPSYYDLLSVAPTAPTDEIKRAFRREIAKYHPDKVQHLGHEFQEIAAVRAAELTRAYKTLTDESQRADYDTQLGRGGTAPAESSRTTRAPESPFPRAAATTRPAQSHPADPAPPASSRGDGAASPARTGAGDLVQKAALGRFRQVLEIEFGQCDQTPIQGFDIACVPQKGRFWSKLPPVVLARFVAQVDAAAVSESWTLAAHMKRDDHRDVCIFVMGPVVASAAELARVIAGERRGPMAAGGKLTLVPVNTRSWSAYIPNDAPPAVKSLVGRLQST